jgi:hypothetical protein
VLTFVKINNSMKNFNIFSILPGVSSWIGPATRCSGRPKLPRQFVPVRNFEPRLFVPMPGNMGRPA